MAEMAHRDERDANRNVAPLKQAADAVLLDTSDLSLEETVDAMLAMIKARHLVS